MYRSGVMTDARINGSSNESILLEAGAVTGY